MNKLVGFGSTISWDSTGGNSFVVLASVVDGDKLESKTSFAATTLLADTFVTKAKTEIDPGSLKFTIAYLPGGTEFEELKAAHILMNAPAPHWELSFIPDGEASGSGSGVVTESFYAHVGSLSREIKKKDFLVCEITLELTGPI